MNKRYSILYPLNQCALCGKTAAETTIQIHEVFFGTANRKKSIQYGCCVGLCLEHHTVGKEAVHHNRQNDLKLKRDYEFVYIMRYGYEQFMAVFHKNYLDDTELYYAELAGKLMENAYHTSRGELDG